MGPVKIAVFASGSGTNAEKLILHFRDNPFVQVQLVVTDRRLAGVVERARKLGVAVAYFPKEVFADPADILGLLRSKEIVFILLAGFLLRVPVSLVQVYQGRILNLHPALLPKYGGKGMYGRHVHEAVLAAGERETGITIHEVNEVYDEGRIVFQATCPVRPDDTADSLAARVHELEHKHYPLVAEKFISERLKNL